ncbi:MAG: hypothetical protein K1X64_05625 [Myxococcaceae bacterium]|nr:hypothetical protein [Myxococcaceae bacterium]
MKKTLWLALWALAACSSNPPPQLFDAGIDAGVPDAGPLDAGEADAGRPIGFLCDIGQACDAGAHFTCTYIGRSDGGLGTECVAGACDVVQQNCDGGMKCGFADGGRACVPDGTVNEGEPCTASNCKRGLACVVVPAEDGGQASECTRYCHTNSDCMAPQQCYVTLNLPGIAERPRICAEPPLVCNLLTQDCPKVGEACYPTSSGPGCFSAGPGADGASCSFSNDCVKGTACIGTQCQKLCAFPSGTPACTTGTCARLTGYSDAGVCVQP